MPTKREFLSRGTFGIVFKETTASRILAVKIPSKHPESIKLLKHEIAIHSQLKHPNLVAFVNDYTPSDLSTSSFLVMEFLAKGELFARLKEGQLDLHLQYSLSLDIANGLRYLHSLGIVHRDMKPENVLLTDHNGRFTAKIADLGCAAYMTDQNALAEKRGTDDYFSPELFSAFSSKERYLQKHKIFPYSAKSDVYAFAIIMWMMIQRRNMFPSPERTHQQVLLGARGAFPTNTPQRQRELITHCWMQDPRHRLKLPAVITELQALQDTLSIPPPLLGEKEIKIENEYSDVFRSIEQFYQYGETLRANNRFNAGNKAIKLAEDLKTIMDSYINQTLTKPEISEQLSKLLTEGYVSMGQDRRFRDYVAHFIFACTGIGLIILLIHKCCYGRFFLNETQRQNKIEKVRLAVEQTDLLDTTLHSCSSYSN